MTTPIQREELKDKLADLLQKKVRDGDETVWLSDNSREFLKEIYLSKGSTVPKSSDKKISYKAELNEVRSKKTELKVREEPKKVIPELKISSTGTKEDRIDEIKKLLLESELKNTDTLRDELVFSKGNSDADIMFVGEAPGYEEEQKGEPFVGPAGKLLDKIITTMGVSLDEIYVSNIIKYRPKIAGVVDQLTRNRKPTSGEMELFQPYFFAEIDVVEPKMIIALGASAIEGLTGYSGSVGKAREQWFDHQGIPVKATYHPSYLLRNEALTERRKLWVDMLQVMEKLGMEITEDQKRYFKS